MLRRDLVWSEETPFTHVGASFGEFEFRRYAPRPALEALIQDCDLIQVVAGVPAWAWPVIGLGKPVALQVATLARVEREKRLSLEHFPMREWRRGMTHLTTRLDNAALRSVDAVLVENQWMLEYARRVNSTRRDCQVCATGCEHAAFSPRRQEG